MSIQKMSLIRVFEKAWKTDLVLFAGGVLFVLGWFWTVLLWRLKRCLPRTQTR
jgi:hypothetical protein